MADRTEKRRAGLFSRLENPGLGPVQEKLLNTGLVLLVVLFTGGWAVAIADAYRSGRSLNVAREVTASPVSSNAPPPAAFLLDRLVRATTEEAPWRGHSGAVSALITDPDGTLDLADTLGLQALPEGATLELQQVDSPGVRAPATQARGRPGAWNVLVRLRDEVQAFSDLAVLSPVSADLIREGRLGRYLVGSWPARGERPARLRTPSYDPPRGLIAVTPANRDLPISEHLVLGDFLTKGQTDVWPKYVAISPRILDKLELTFQELERSGHPVENVGIISGFRTPYYNAHGGSTSGRGSVSRHMYGDAMDFYVDNDGDGRMDDLNGDGRIDRGDAAVIARAAGRVEAAYPQYVG
ncbi:MAG: DUF882 domain-containing protein, partial [Gemmatimonadetes bacterium]|nr:DUF882 domain-containing protein [Gemmatimonadota bacterium]NIQ58918.1 DUF882 domain-containing protein [Gemmatimonadota bacterium]NIU79103.1 DUF882 domain-containing protein [Gammaproteobacteria bacterium]NIX47818.1 DUF882 domain-containing protein [Gemmatimonadota bacterium]NIY12178.1 DUF882 domain-containing protein [Gemmatimonadota bacterium]